ncbi:NAD(P)-binding protein [Heliocybe sulcata]|uniref:NAD(P)-binding protein n=1 Tax=Heliocybe sulcata TaxID=5364 RepID=A0A5C3N9L8_9AGAM|nr:NAD(P)-binding protein [Heliocybe sulcata]
MATVSDEGLLAFSSTARDQVVLITGGAKGIGREAAVLFAKHGAKVVIGDIDPNAGHDVVDTITRDGGAAIYQRCNVLEWDDLVSLFEKAIETYGRVNSVLPIAGIATEKPFPNIEVVNGRPVKPQLTTLDINLRAVMHTTHIAFHYFKKDTAESGMKSIVFMASMASWQGIPGVAEYSAAKHGVLGFMRAIEPISQLQGIHVASVHPWFVDTTLLPLVVKTILAGIPKTPVERVAYAVFYAATNPDWANQGSTLLLPDDGPVLRLNKEELKEGVYGIINNRAQRAKRTGEAILSFAATLRDLWKIFGKGVMVAMLCAVAARWARARYLRS